MRMIPQEGFLRRYVDLHAPLSEAPEEAHFAAALALLSAAVGWKAWIQWGGSPEPLTLWVVLEGQSAAARKTTTSGTALSLARRAQTQRPGVDPCLVTHRVSHISDAGLIELIAPKDKEQGERWEAEPPPGTLLEWDEFGAVLGRPGDIKGSDWIGRLQARLMEVYGGRHGGIKTRASQLPAGRCAVALIATMTRRELEQRVSSGLLETGFMGRFVLIPFHGRTRVISRPPAWGDQENAASEELAVWLARLADNPAPFGHVFDRLTTQAGGVWDDWYVTRSRELEARADLTGDPEDAALFSAFNRLQTTAMKVAGLMCLQEWDGVQPLATLRVEPRHINSGVGLAEHALEEVRSLLACDQTSPEGEWQRKVVEVLRKRNGHGPIGIRELIGDVRARGVSYSRKKSLLLDLHPETVTIKQQVSGVTRQTKTVVELTKD